MGAVESPHINSRHKKKNCETEDWLKCSLRSFAEYIMVSSIMASALGILQYSTMHISEAGKC